MADVKNEAVKTIAEEIVAAINSVVEKNNKSYVNTQVANHSGSSSSGGGGGGGGSGTDNNAVHYTQDNKTALEKSVARTNIDAQGKSEDISTANGTFGGTLTVGANGQLVVAGDTEVQDIQVDGTASINYLEAQNGEINHGIIRYGNTQEQIFTNATGNKLTIDRLIVLYAQIANAVIGNFVFEDTGDAYYKLSITVDSDGRYVLTPTQYSPTAQEIAQGYTNPNPSTGEGQKQIIDSMMSSASMSGSNVSIVNQMFGTVTASTMNVARLVAVKGFIGKLYTGIIESPLMVVGDDTVYDMGNATESVTAPTSPSNNDLWIDTSTTPRHLKQYKSATSTWQDKGELSNVNSAINLSDKRIKLVVDVNNTTPTSLALTDDAVEAIGNKINLIANEIVLTVGNDIESTSSSYLAGKIQTVARNDSQISTAIQEAGKIAWMVASGSTSSSITLTENMVSAMSSQINISAAKMQAHIDEVDLSGNTTTVECFTDVDITESPAAPTNPSKNDLWRDTSLITKPLKIYNGSSWTVVDESSLIGILSRTQVKISADGIESTVKANSNLSTSLQNADKMQWLITNGSSSTSITLTQSMINAVSGQINITAEKINAVADQIDLSGNNVSVLIGNAQTTANNANSAASAAQSTANSAVSAASTAQSTADSASTAASNAQSTANSATSAANTAQSTANNAVSAASTAQSTANAAQTSANTANSAARSAQNTADAAVTKTDFQRIVRMDDAGVHIGDNQTSCETLIDSESFNVLIDGVRYSRFAANYVQFGSYQMRETADGGMAFVFV